MEEGGKLVTWQLGCLKAWISEGLELVFTYVQWMANWISGWKTHKSRVQSQVKHKKLFHASAVEVEVFFPLFFFIHFHSVQPAWLGDTNFSQDWDSDSLRMTFRGLVSHWESRALAKTSYSLRPRFFVWPIRAAMTNALENWKCLFAARHASPVSEFSCFYFVKSKSNVCTSPKLACKSIGQERVLVLSRSDSCNFGISRGS